MLQQPGLLLTLLLAGGPSAVSATVNYPSAISAIVGWPSACSASVSGPLAVSSSASRDAADSASAYKASASSTFAGDASSKPVMLPHYALFFDVGNCPAPSIGCRYWDTGSPFTSGILGSLACSKFKVTNEYCCGLNECIE